MRKAKSGGVGRWVCDHHMRKKINISLSDMHLKVTFLIVIAVLKMLANLQKIYWLYLSFPFIIVKKKIIFPGYS